MRLLWIRLAGAAWFMAMSHALSDLVGQRILVTGSSGGIGAGIARVLGRAGARVLVVRNTTNTIVTHVNDGVSDAPRPPLVPSTTTRERKAL